jgi:hypothetical protein
MIQQLAGEALQLQQFEEGLVSSYQQCCPSSARILPSSLRNGMRVGLQATVDVFPARTRG